MYDLFPIKVITKNIWDPLLKLSAIYGTWRTNKPTSQFIFTCSQKTMSNLTKNNLVHTQTQLQVSEARTLSRFLNLPAFLSIAFIKFLMLSKSTSFPQLYFFLICRVVTEPRFPLSRELLAIKYILVLHKIFIEISTSIRRLVIIIEYPCREQKIYYVYPTVHYII